MFLTKASPDPVFSDTLELDLDEVVPALAGPKRPQDRIDLKDVKKNFLSGLGEEPRKVTALMNGQAAELQDGSVVIAAITSCTNTSNPSVMLAAGLLAKKAVEKGLKVQPHVKTSLAPGSKVVMDYYQECGPAAVPGTAQLPPGRLRLYHLHRKQRAAARNRRGHSLKGEARSRGGAQRESQFRRPHQPAGTRQLPRFPAPRRRVRSCRPRRYRPAEGTPRNRRRTATKST